MIPKRDIVTHFTRVIPTSGSSLRHAEPKARNLQRRCHGWTGCAIPDALPNQLPQHIDTISCKPGFIPAKTPPHTTCCVFEAKMPGFRPEGKIMQ